MPKERTLDIENILSELRKERDRINAAIDALEGGAVSSAAVRRGCRRRQGIGPGVAAESRPRAEDACHGQ